MTIESSRKPAGNCNACESSERRQFIQAAVAGVVALVGLSLADTESLVAQIAPVLTTDSAREDRIKYAIPAADSVSIDMKNEVILARAGGSMYAFTLSCPHQNTALRWLQKDGRFQCPKHKSKYSATGQFIDGRATRNMDRLPISLDGTLVAVEVSHEIRSDTEPAKWAAAVVQLPS